jgi:DNA-binding transcriptional ArsR family regulator
MDGDSILKQAAADRAYLRACREAGIKPELPRYEVRKPGGTVEGGFVDPVSFSSGPIAEESEDLRAGVLRALLEKLLEAGGRGNTSAGELSGLKVQVLGVRLVVLCWLLGIGPAAGMPLDSLGKRIGLTRSALSWHSRKLAKLLGLRSPGVRHDTSNLSKARRAAVDRGRGNTRRAPWKQAGPVE